MNLLQKTIIIMLFSCVPLIPVCAETVDSSRNPICDEIQRRYDQRTLKEIILTDSHIEDPQNIDIDNDGLMETIAYFPTRTYMAMLEIVDGKRKGAVETLEVTARYNGADIVRVSGKNYVLHYYEPGPFELTELIENPTDKNSRTYTSKNICKFY